MNILIKEKLKNILKSLRHFKELFWYTCTKFLWTNVKINNERSFFMTSTFILSGKKLIYVSRRLFILFLVQIYMLSLTPCHIARGQSTKKHFVKQFQTKKISSSWFCTPVVFLGSLSSWFRYYAYKVFYE